MFMKYDTQFCLKTFSERLKELRNERKLTVRALAQEIQVSFTVIGLWENNKRIPSIENLYKLAKFFGVSSDFLLGLRDY